ncbi:proton-coupled amino acid transporter-like protein pathetic [Neocloeon triangulifer]|uniref:proton-coupled amino acid transporter-like protein pathetic n=1 Tax=Neocloeon triangulifer TaxID=2078957 RepID=UPI00286EBAE1|nr:proton-coupled amino acid transporter-like protein pathetic [Neocloeon triangulifer]
MDVSKAEQGTELETFLPKDGVKNHVSGIGEGVQGKYIAEANGDGALRKAPAEAPFDPFKERKIDHPTTDCDTLTHLLKASLGSGILAMPIAFKHAGLTMGVFATVFVAIICTHCSYILVKCAHALYARTRVTAMSFADVGTVSFRHGPAWSRPYAQLSRMTILVSLFLTYFGTCSVYTVIIASNFQQVIEHHTQVFMNERYYIAALLIPLILLSWVPNLKYLAPVSMLANGLMGCGLGITVYYLTQDLPATSERPHFNGFYGMPQFFSIVIFAMEAIGVVMPLENNMKNPRHFLGLAGVLNQGMAGVTLIYILLGFLGYLKYGDDTEGSITLNLPTDEILAQSVKILIALAVFCTYGLQFFVCLEICWDGVKDRYKGSRIAEYVLRTVLVTLTVALAVAVPTIGPFIGLIGALCFSILGLICPAVIEMVTFWEDGLGPGKWRLWKNVAVMVFGVMALIFGTITSLEDIARVYSEDHKAHPEEEYLMINQTIANVTSSVVEAIATTLAPVDATTIAG